VRGLSTAEENSKTVGATPREGSNPSPGTLRQQGFRLVWGAEPEPVESPTTATSTATELLEDPESRPIRGSAALEVLDTCTDTSLHGRLNQLITSRV
jgi:hypothetical protein